MSSEVLVRLGLGGEEGHVGQFTLARTVRFLAIAFYSYHAMKGDIGAPPRVTTSVSAARRFRALAIQRLREG